MRIRIKELARKSGKTMSEVATALDVTTRTLRNWNKGKNGASFSNLEGILRIFNCEIVDIFEL